MEFPNLGKNCSFSSCRQLDFLPFHCSGCNKHFCQEHASPEAHHCPSPSAQSRTVPVCPLCEKPVAIGPNEDPNTKVWEHIDRGCPKSDLVHGEKAKNICSLKKCKETGGAANLLVECPRCRRKFCLKHRLEVDHSCGQPSALKPAPGRPLSGWVGRTASQRHLFPSGAPRAVPTAAAAGRGRAGASGRAGKSKESEWECPRCTLKNPKVLKACSACGYVRPTSSTTAAGAQRQTTIDGFASQTGGRAGQTQSASRSGGGGRGRGTLVSCSTCTLLQPETNGRCEACGTPLPRRQRPADNRRRGDEGSSCTIF